MPPMAAGRLGVPGNGRFKILAYRNHPLGACSRVLGYLYNGWVIWVSEPGVATRNAEQKQGESPQEELQRTDRELARSVAASATVKSFKDYVVQDLGKREAHALAVTMGITYTVAKRMLHRRDQRLKEGQMLELTSSVRTDPIMAVPKPSAARRAKKNLKASAKAWAEKQKHRRW